MIPLVGQADGHIDRIIPFLYLATRVGSAIWKITEMGKETECSYAMERRSSCGNPKVRHAKRRQQAGVEA